MVNGIAPCVCSIFERLPVQDSIQPMTSVKIDGSAVRRLREENELTQLYLATVVGVTTDTISRWENNKYPAIKLENAQKLAQALGVALEEIQEQQKEVEQDEVDADKSDEKLAQRAPVSPIKKGITSRRNLFFTAGVVVLAALIAGGIHLLHKNKESVVWATRTVPLHTAPGLPFPVIVRLVADDPIDIPILLRETISGKAVAKSIQAGEGKSVQDFGATPRWIGRLTHGQAVFLYMVYPEKELVNGEKLTIAGDCISGKSEKNAAEIEGPGTVEITGFHWADTDKDFVITDNEILDAYELYSSGNVEVDFHDLEMLWLAGGYKWNEQTMALVPITQEAPPQGE